MRAAHCGPRALQLAQQAPVPGLILLDVMMPGMGGHEVLGCLQAEPATRDIPVIFTTAMNGTLYEHRGLVLGAVDYITQPLQPAIVMARVGTQLALKKARDQLRRHNAALEAEVAERMRENVLIQDVTIARWRAWPKCATTTPATTSCAPSST